MMYPLVRELAVDGIPVTVTCRVLKDRSPALLPMAPEPGHRRRARAGLPATALFDAHKDDPEFGYRYLVEEARDAGESMAERTAWRICSTKRWWSAFGKPKRGKAKKPARRSTTTCAP